MTDISKVYNNEHFWQKTISIANAAYNNKLFPSAVFGVKFSDKETKYFSNGEFSSKSSVSSSNPATPHTIYDAASITKAIPTSTIALQLAREEQWSLQDKLIDWLPEYQGDLRDELRIIDLIDFRIPFAGSLSQLKKQPLSGIRQHILQATVNQDKMKKNKNWYINTTSILLGLAIERVECKKLHLSANQRCFVPGQMVDSSLYYSKHLERTAPAEFDTWRNRDIQGEVHDESAWKLSGGEQRHAQHPLPLQAIDPGSAGLFTTASDILNFFAQDSTWELLEWSLEHYHAVLGWEQHTDWLGEAGKKRTVFGKTGFTGCAVFGDVETRTVGVMLSNATYPQRPESKEPLNQIRRELVQALLLP